MKKRVKMHAFPFLYSFSSAGLQLSMREHALGVAEAEGGTLTALAAVVPVVTGGTYSRELTGL